MGSDMDIRNEIKRDVSETTEKDLYLRALCGAFSIYGNLHTFLFLSDGVVGSTEMVQVPSLQRENLARISCWRMKRVRCDQ